MNNEPASGRFSLLYRNIRNAVNKAVEHLSFAERVLFLFFSVALVFSAITVVFRLNDYLLVEVPAKGGSIAEGIIGSPRFINPVLAISDADRDLTALVYSGLMKTAPNGTLINDLASNYTVSEDGLTYTFTLKENIFFHDKMPISTDDVEFTISKAQDSALKSLKRANWDSVRVEKVSDREIRFILKQPYAPFLENATIGILPKHIWKNISNEEFAFSFYNVEPIGSGPFMIDRINKNSSGIPEQYVLSSFKDYSLGEPYIEKLIISLYPNEQTLIDAFNRGDVENISSISPQEVSRLSSIESNMRTTPLSRIFAVFFNQNQANIFANAYVRRALDIAVDKKAIVEKVLYGFGSVAEGPVPRGFLDKSADATEATSTDRNVIARNILEKAGFTVNKEGIYEKKAVKKNDSPQVLSFSLSTSNAPELKETASLIKEAWEKIGVKVELKIFEPGDLSQNVIRPRKYDALLFGEIIGRDLDLFAFWHSSQRNDPGLNIALYTNVKADKLLTEARTLPTREERLEKYREFEIEINKDVPAVFLYSPSFIYLTPKILRGVNLGYITVPGERFANAHNWYVETEKIWKIFISKRLQT